MDATILKRPLGVREITIPIGRPGDPCSGMVSLETLMTQMVSVLRGEEPRKDAHGMSLPTVTGAFPRIMQEDLLIVAIGLRYFFGIWVPEPALAPRGKRERWTLERMERLLDTAARDLEAHSLLLFGKQPPEGYRDHHAWAEAQMRITCLMAALLHLKDVCAVWSKWEKRGELARIWHKRVPAKAETWPILSADHTSRWTCAM